MNPAKRIRTGPDNDALVADTSLSSSYQATQSFESISSPSSPSSSTNVSKDSKIASSFMQISTFQEGRGFSYGTVHKLWVMLELEAVKQDIWMELPLDLVICIDISGSMKLAGKLLHLQATMEYFITKLTPCHRLCLIAFNQEVTMLTDGLMAATDENKNILLSALHSLQPAGSTNIGDALFKALDVLKQARTSAPPSAGARISSVMLFTDGLANVGLRGKEFNEALRRTQIPSDLVVNTFGFGEDHDSTMLRNIALSSCGGVYYYLPHAQAIPSIFGECLAGLLHTVIYDVNVTLQACDGCRIVRFCTSYPIHEKKENKLYEVSFGSMYRYEKKSLLFRLSLKKLVAEWENHPLLTTSVSFRTVQNGKQYQLSQRFFVSRPAVTPKEEVPEPLDMQINRVTAAHAMDQAIACGHKEEFVQAIQHLTEAVTKIEGSKTGSSSYSRTLVQDLLNCVDSMKQRFTSTGVHVANAYSAMYYAERSTGTAYFDTVDGENNNNQDGSSPSKLGAKEKDSQAPVLLSVGGSSPSSSSSASSGSSSRRPGFNRYQTFDQIAESQTAQKASVSFLSHYVVFDEGNEEETSEPANRTPLHHDLPSLSNFSSDNMPYNRNSALQESQS